MFFVNRQPRGLPVQKAITGFLQYKSVVGLAPITISATSVNSNFELKVVVQDK